MRLVRTPAAPWVAAAVTLLAVAVLVPARASTVLAVAQLGGAVVVAVRLRSGGALASRVGGGIVLVLAVLGASSALLAVVGPGNRASVALIIVAQVIGLLALAPPLARHRRAPGASGASALVGAELAIVVVGAGLLVLQAGTAAHRGGGATSRADAVTAGADIVALAVILWLALTRTGISVAARLTMAGCGLLVLQNYLATVTQVVLGSAEEAGQPVGVLAAVLLAAAGAHRTVLDAGDRSRAPVLRRGATRLLVVLPFSLVPAFAWAAGVLDPTAAMPPWVLIGTALVVTVLALLRALGLVAESERAADTDPLTGRLGRRGVLRRIEALHAARRPTWVVLVNLDDFTEVNERHGQEVGDGLLRAVLDRLARLPGRPVVARLGGDELLVLLPADAATDVEEVVGAARAAVRDPFVVDGATVAITASAGAASLDAAATPGEALGCADLAMRAAKARGGDRALVYAPEVREEVLGPLQIQRELRVLLDGGSTRAGTADGVGRLVVAYQPLVSLPDGAPVGVEALVRWHHPERGVVRPDLFLPLAEQAGVGALLDRAVLRQGLHQLAAWDALGLDVEHLGVNLGRASMREPGLLAHVLAACAEAGVSPSRLALEITEHDELDTDAGVVTDLLALREVGVSVALDDFGAGHASVGYLRRWPANIVKLDRSLLPSVAPARPHAAMLDPTDLIVAVGSLVFALKRQLLVEGIEDEGDLAVACSAGADLGQGYHFARPMEPERLVAWWRARVAKARPVLPGAAGLR